MTPGILQKLPQLEAGFRNDRDGYELGSGCTVLLDSDRLEYFEAYAANNFQGPLVLGYGTEAILDMLSRIPSGVNWLDLGAGTTSLFWTAALGRCETITAVDVFPEALEILKRTVEGDSVSECMVDALARYNRNAAHIEEARAACWRYLVFDFVQPWPSHLSIEKYDLVTAFGCFGLGENPRDHFATSLENTRTFVESAGRIIGANWLRTERSIAQEGYDTSFLTDGFIQKTCTQCSLRLEQCVTVKFENDPRFAGLKVWRADAIS